LWELRELGMDRVSRLDLALDFYGQGLTLIDDVLGAADRGELCRLRKWSPQGGKKMVGRRVVRDGHGVRLGRQSANGKVTELYDKGLQMGQPEGTWIRWETRLYGRRAWDALNILFAAREYERTGETTWQGLEKGWKAAAMAIALGVVEFRDPARGASRSLKRRPLAGWWADFLGQVKGVHVRVAGRGVPRLDDVRRWLKRAFFPMCRSMIRARQGDVQEVLVDLGLFDEWKEGGRSEVLHEYERMVVGKEAAA
jgi:hypothetical protein